MSEAHINTEPLPAVDPTTEANPTLETPIVDPSYPALMGLRRAILAGQVSYLAEDRAKLQDTADFESHTSYVNLALVDRRTPIPEYITPGTEQPEQPVIKPFSPPRMKPSRKPDVDNRDPAGYTPGFGDTRTFVPGRHEAKGLRQEVRSMGKNLQLDKARNANQKLAKWRRLYGDVIFDSEAVEDQIKDGHYSRKQRKALKQASKQGVRMNRTIDRGVGKVERTHRRFTRDPRARLEARGLDTRIETKQDRLEELRELHREKKAEDAIAKQERKERWAERRQNAANRAKQTARDIEDKVVNHIEATKAGYQEGLAGPTGNEGFVQTKINQAARATGKKVAGASKEKRKQRKQEREERQKQNHGGVI